MGSDNDSVEFVSSPDLIRKPAHIHAVKDLAPLLIACWLCFGLNSSGAEPLSAGPLFHEFSLTLEPGQRFEALGPLFGQERSDGEYRLSLRRVWGKPTVVNNVETLVNVLDVVLEAGPAFAAIGTSGSTGTKLFCVSGQVVRPGLYEVPFGITLAELLERAGGVPLGRRLLAVLLGGSAGSFLTPADLGVPLTFEGTRAIGASLGSGGVVVLDDSVDLWDIVLRIAAFFRDESCGQCVPCRVGTVRQEEALHRLARGQPVGSKQDEVQLLADLAQAMRDASICGLGHTAGSAAASAIERLGLLNGGRS
jgi:NADH-quinone oxidoreductase subunit F